MTYSFDSSKDFIDQFKYLFSVMKGACQRDDKVTNYHIIQGLPDNATDYEDEEEQTDCKLNISQLKAELKWKNK